MNAEIKKYNITLLGCGKMGSALLSAWLGKSLVGRVLAVDPHSLPEQFLTLDQISYTASLPDDISGFDDVLVIAIKPQIMRETLQTLSPVIPQHTLVISIAAGQTLLSIEEILKPESAVIRSMPNTPAAIGKGMTVAVSGRSVTAQQKECADILLRASGELEWLSDESLMDAVTALSGSGPAYIFYLIECLAAAGERIGLPTKMAQTLARQTVIGSAALAEYTPEISAEQLRKNVTSPNGTTQAALDILMDGKFRNALTDALSAARNRSKELSS